MTFGPLFLVLLGLGQNEAEKLFRQMEEQIAKASALECAFETDNLETGKITRVKGTLLWTKGNKARLDLQVQVRDQTRLVMHTMISDGRQMRIRISGDGKSEDHSGEPPNVLDRLVPASLVRFSLAPLMFVEPISPGSPNPEATEEAYGVSNFGLGKKERVGTREAQRIDYQLKLPGHERATAIALWIDVQTLLPLKRVVSPNPDDAKSAVTETYGQIRLNGRIDSKKFELPK
jgi:outer membrane lipoprotein-sorting protein